MINNIICAVFLIAGAFFMAVSVLGVFRFRDFYSRLQVMGVGQALGTVLCCLGLFCYEGFSNTGIKIIMVMILTLFGGPIGTHIIDKVAYKEAVRNSMQTEGNREEEKICL
ncbi:MAG: monovalent cation/H(+) antiporter subunit G [Firmicutes bacterium]|nr:monovalent cation/H(+) antiporter subunit G [Bacillota bacterium]